MWLSSAGSERYPAGFERRVVPFLLALALAGCIRAPVTTSATSPLAEIRKMLSTRATALSHSDINGFLAPLSAEARAFEAPIAGGASRVPLVDIHFVVGKSNPVAPGSFKRLPVDFVYGYRGLPSDNIFRLALVYDVDRSEDGWKVSTSRLDTVSTLPVWVTGPIASSDSEHFLALFRPGTTAGPVLLNAEQARARLAAKLTFSMDTGHLILLARDRREYEEMSARRTPVSAVAQSETDYVVTTKRISAEGRSIIANLEQLTGDAAAVETFQHELGHLALAPYTRPFTPGWVSESAAMYLAGTRPVALWNQGLRAGKFGAISFAGLTPLLNLQGSDPTSDGLSYEYAYSAAAAWYLVETFGASRYWEFYRSYSEVPPAEVYGRIPGGVAGPGADAALSQLAVETTNNSLSRVFGLTQDELDARVRTWMRTRVG